MIKKEIEKFYNENYVHYKILMDTKYVNTQIWSVRFDENYDLIYLFKAEVTYINEFEDQEVLDAPGDQEFQYEKKAILPKNKSVA